MKLPLLTLFLLIASVQVRAAETAGTADPQPTTYEEGYRQGDSIANLAGKVQGLDGDVYINGVKAKEGDSILYGSRVEVRGQDGFVRIAFADGSQLQMGPSSELRIDSFVYDGKGRTVTLNLISGIARFISGTFEGQSLPLRTPVAINGIRA